MQGGLGADIFRLLSGDDQADAITDFQLGVDAIDVRDLVASPPGIGGSYVGMVSATQAAGINAKLHVLTEDHGWEVVARLEGITAAQANAAIQDGSLFTGHLQSVDGPGGWLGGEMHVGANPIEVDLFF